MLKLLLGLALAGAFSFSFAQTPPPVVTTSQFYDAVKPKLQDMTASQVTSFYGTGQFGGIYPTSQTFSFPMSVGDWSGTVSIGAGGVFNLLALSYNHDALGDSNLLCYFGKIESCSATNETLGTSGTEASGNMSASKRICSPYGTCFTFSLSSRYLPNANPHWNSSISDPYGNAYGAPDIVSGNNSGGGCTYRTAGGILNSYYETGAAGISAADAVVINWVGVTYKSTYPGCVPFGQFVGSGGSAASFSKAAVDFAKADDIDPSTFFAFSAPISFVNPSTGGGTDGGSTPGTGDGTASYVPATDNETSCAVLDLFCWTRWAFVPQQDWGTNFSTATSAGGSKVPFGWVNWMTANGDGGGSYSDCGAGSLGLGGLGVSCVDGFNLQTSDYVFKVGDRDIALPDISLGNSLPMQWWRTTGRLWMFWAFQGAFYFWLLKEARR